MVYLPTGSRDAALGFPHPSAVEVVMPRVAGDACMRVPEGGSVDGVSDLGWKIEEAKAVLLLLDHVAVEIRIWPASVSASSTIIPGFVYRV